MSATFHLAPPVDHQRSLGVQQCLDWTPDKLGYPRYSSHQGEWVRMEPAQRPNNVYSRGWGDLTTAACTCDLHDGGFYTTTPRAGELQVPIQASIFDAMKNKQTKYQTPTTSSSSRNVLPQELAYLPGGSSMLSSSSGYVGAPIEQRKKFFWEVVPIPGRLVQEERPTSKKKTRHLYRVVTNTDSSKGAACDAKVYITLRGTRGKMVKRQLTKHMKDTHKFSRGQADTFHYVKNKDIGDLSAIVIHFASPGTWLLSHVLVTKTNQNTGQSKSWNFYCDKWLKPGRYIFTEDGDFIGHELEVEDEEEDEDEDDKENVVSTHITPRGEPHCEVLSLAHLVEVPTVKYKLEVYTGNTDSEGITPSNSAYVRLTGNSNATDKVPLESGSVKSNNKESIHVMEMTVEAENLGDLQKLQLGHEGGEPWFVDHVLVTCPSPRRTWYCHCGKWVNRENRERTLAPGTATDYRIEVVTGRQEGAGTAAKVYITLYGRADHSPRTRLAPPGRRAGFGPGTSHIFTCKTAELGELTKCRIQHDDTGADPDWFLKKVTVREDRGARRQWEFCCGQWLASGRGDRLTARVLLEGARPHTPDGEKTNKIREQKQLRDKDKKKNDAEYHVTVYTGKKQGAGTDADVSVTLYGGRERHTQRLGRSGNRYFKAGRSDEFTLLCKWLGPLHKLRIGHDDSGQASDWLLEKVVVKDTVKKKVYEFMCGDWLARRRGLKLIQIELQPEDDDSDKESDRGRGEDRDRSRDRSRERSRDRSRERSRERGRGRIRERDRSSSSERETAKGKTKTKKKCNKGDVCTYELRLQTGDVKGDGREARPYITLYGDKENTDKIPLKAHNTDVRPAGKGRVYTYSIHTADIGELNKLVIGYNKSVGSKWYLEHVEVTCAERAHTWKCMCRDWLNEDQSERTLYPAQPIKEVEKVDAKSCSFCGIFKKGKK